MNSSASKTLDIPVSTGMPRWLLRGLIATLALLVLGLLALAFLLGHDDASPTPASPASVARPAAVMAAPQPAATSDGIEEVPRPVSTHRVIAGMEVDANGDAKDPDIVHPGDDSAYLNDGDDGQNHSGKDADTH